MPFCGNTPARHTPNHHPTPHAHAHPHPHARSLGYMIEDIESPDQIEQAAVLVFPGVGSFGNAMEVLLPHVAT